MHLSFFILRPVFPGVVLRDHMLVNTIIVITMSKRYIFVQRIDTVPSNLFHIKSNCRRNNSLIDRIQGYIRIIISDYFYITNLIIVYQCPVSYTHLDVYKRQVYIGLQQHTIDAQENPYEVIVSNNLYEQQDYVVETNHLPHLISLIVNDKFFKDLPEDEQEIMTEAAQLATEYAREQSDARIADKIATIKESGTEIITLSNETRKEIREASKGVYESIREVIDPKIYDSYMDGIEE